MLKEEKFMELLGLKRKIAIEGGSRTGKTILAKYLEIIESYAAVVLNALYAKFKRYSYVSSLFLIASSTYCSSSPVA